MRGAAAELRDHAATCASTDRAPAQHRGDEHIARRDALELALAITTGRGRGPAIPEGAVEARALEPISSGTVGSRRAAPRL